MRRQITSKNKDFQAVLRQKQPDANSAMIKWTSSVHQTSLKPTWKSLLLVLRLINLDHLAEEINTYLSGGAAKQLPEGPSASKEQDSKRIIVHVDKQQAVCVNRVIALAWVSMLTCVFSSCNAFGRGEEWELRFD